MNKYVVIILSIVLIFLSLCGIVSKIISPTIKNQKYFKEIEKYDANYEQRKNEVENVIEQEKNNATLEFTDIPKTDSQRVGMYIGKYIGYVNSKNYVEAYALLADEFKQLNFPTLEDYIKWADEKFPRKKSVEYVNYRLQGYTYIVDTKLIDWPIYDNPQTIEKVFTFQEIKEGEFKISFGM